MCDKGHKNTEEAIECRNKERESDLIAALRKGSSNELLLHDCVTLHERAVRENDPKILMDEKFWNYVKERIGR